MTEQRTGRKCKLNKGGERGAGGARERNSGEGNERKNTRNWDKAGKTQEKGGGLIRGVRCRCEERAGRGRTQVTGLMKQIQDRCGEKNQAGEETEHWDGINPKI